MAGKKIGLTLALDGEREFTQAVQNANKEANLFKTELKNLSKEFEGNANSMKALEAKQEALTRLQDAYQKKLEVAEKGLENANKIYNEQADTLSELNKKLEEAKNIQKKMEDANEESSESYKKQVEEVQKLEHEVSKQNTATLKASASVTEWNRKISESKSAIRQSNRALEENEKYLKEAEIATDGCAKSIDKFGKATKDAEEVTTTLGDKIGNALVTKGVSMAVDALKEGAEKVKESMYDISEASSQLQASTGLSESSMERYKKVMDSIKGDNFGENYGDIADVMGEIVQIMGEINPSAMKETTESAIALRDTFGMDINEQIRAVDVMMKTMGVDAQAAFDFIAAGAQNGLNRSGELVDNIAEYGQLWGQAGFSAEEMFAILENGLDAGAYNLDKVNDYVKEFGNSLADGRIEKNLSYFSDGTKSLFAEWKNGTVSTSDVFYSVINDLSEMTNQQEALTVASEVWSALGEDNAMQVLTALDDVNDKYKEVKGAMESLKEVQYSDLETSIGSLGSAIQEKIVTPIANKALPVIKSALDGITEAIDPPKTMMEEFCDEVVSASDSVRTAAAGMKESMENAVSDADKINAYKDILLKLNDVESKSQYEKYQMRSIVSELSGLVPELSEAFNEETASLSLSNNEIERMLSHGSELAKYQALIGMQAEADKALMEAQVNRAKADSAVAAAEDALKNGTRENLDQLKNDVVASYKAQKEATKAEEEAEKEHEAYTEAIESVSKSLGDEKDAFNEAGNAASDMSQTQINAAEAVEEAYSQMKDSISDSIESSVSMFNEFSGGTEISKEEVLKNLESSKDGIREWSKNMKILAGRAGEGMTKELYDYLAELGPGSANLVKAYTEMTSEELKQAANDFKQVDFQLPEYISDSLAETSQAWEAGGTEMSQQARDAAEKTKEAARQGTEDTGQEMAEGVKSGAEEVVVATGEVVDRSVETVQQKYTDFRQAGQEASKGIGDGIKANKSDAIQKTIDVAGSAAQSAKSKQSDFYSLGYNLSSGIASGIAAGSPEVEQAVRNAVRRGIDAGKKEADSHSPSRVAEKELGVPIPQGTAKGIDSKAKEVEKSSVNMISTSLNSAKKEVKSHAGEFKDAVGEQISKSVTLGISRGKGKAKKSIKEYAKAVYEEAEKQLENFRKNNVSAMSVSIDDTEWYWDRLLKKSKKKGKKYYSEMKKLVKAEKKELEQQRKAERLDAQETALDSYKLYYNVSPKAEMQYWDVMRTKYKEGTEQRLEADKKYYEAKENYNEKLKDLEDEYYEKCREVQDKLKDAFEERKEEIRSAYGIFDEFTSEAEVPEKLLANMQSQVQGYALWMEELEKLEGKNVLNSDFLDELKKMGPEAAATILSLNMMSEEQLRLANEAYEEKNRLAQEQASRELEQMKQDTQEQLDIYKTTYSKAYAELNKEISEPLKKLAKDSYNSGTDAVANLIKGLKDEANKKSTEQTLQGIQKEIAGGIDGLPAKGKAIGKDTLAGILKGLSNSLEIKKGAKSFVKELEDAIRKEADMHSPSRRFEKLCLDLPAGAAKGIRKGTPAAAAASADMVKSMLEESKKKIGQQQAALQEYLAGINAAGSIAALNNLTAQPAAQTNVIVSNTGAAEILTGVAAEIRSLKEEIKNMGMYIDDDTLVGSIYEKVGEKLTDITRKVR